MPDSMRTGSPIADYDRDSIHTLPLTVLPISSAALARARLIKNHRLETRIELFREASGGSGQIAVDEVSDFFPGDGEGLRADMALLRQLGELPSYDPYTLRIGLRQAGIDLLSLDALQLSAAKRAELKPLMRAITRPLVGYLFGDGGRGGEDLEALVRLIANPDTPAVRRRIEAMAGTLRVDIAELPDMLEDYGDTYLALSYYRSYLLYALPVVDRMVEWMRDARTNSFLRTDANVQRTFRRVEGLLTQITASVSRRFESFDGHNAVDWTAITVERFRTFRRMVSEHQQSLAHVLCGLTVKIYEWEQQFPNGGGSPEKRADFVAADLKPQLDTLWQIESRAAQFGDAEPSVCSQRGA